jgi:hypothetical protein
MVTSLATLHFVGTDAYAVRIASREIELQRIKPIE